MNQQPDAQIEQNSLSSPVNNNSTFDSPENFIEIQKMHVQKPHHSRVILPPKTTQNFVSPTDKNLSPCTMLLQAKKTKNYKNSCKPVFLSNIFAKTLKDQENQAEAEVEVELSEDI